ncbi:MAG: glycosyltransferase family 2 protein [bacterium]|nr:glycosyltransferase family 2 protein [bacterium]
MTEDHDTELPAVDVSYVIPIYDEADGLPDLVAALEELLDELSAEYSVEVLFVDDGSRDDSWRLIVEAADRLPQLAGVRLSRNFGHQVALTCGYQLARGRAVISMDADLQDPPEVSLRMIEEWENGADIVYAVRTARRGETWFKRATASAFYWLIERLRGTGSAPRNSADFRLLSHRALIALNALPERHRYIRGLVGWIGLHTATVHYERQPRRAGSTKYPLLKMLRFATDAIVSMSSRPLRLAYVMALLASLPFLGYLGYNLVQWLFFDVEMVRGWPSLILSVITFGTCILLFMGLLGEYVGRIYDEVKGRPLYLISERTSWDDD